MATNAPPLNTVTRSAQSLTKQPKYYEADGALRAYANISIWAAVIAGVVALGAVAIMFFMRIQPPTVIRVLPSGEASVVGSDGFFKTTTSPAALQSIEGDQAPTAFEKENYVRTFLDRFLNYDSHTLAPNWSYALNMMTGNLKALTLAEFTKSDTVGKYEAEHVHSVFKVAQVTNSLTDPLLYTVTGVRTVNRLTGGQAEAVDEVIESYNVRLADYDRSPQNPAGLLIAEINETQIHSETKQVDVADPGNGGEEKQQP
jgi:hypothetical protein